MRRPPEDDPAATPRFAIACPACGAAIVLYDQLPARIRVACPMCNLIYAVYLSGGNL
jgi:ribosomal protein S27E